MALTGIAWTDPVRPIPEVIGRNPERAFLWQRPGFAAASSDSTAFHASLESGLAVLLDGDVHNLRELRHALSQGGDASPAALLASAYERWGADAFDRFIGDFAAVVHDRTRKRLLLAREPFGMRPLYYFTGPEFTAFATSTRDLARIPGVPRELDLDQFARIVSRAAYSPGFSHLKAVRTVAAGHLAIVENGRESQERWWRPERLPTLRFSSGEACAEALREVLDVAVADRIREKDADILMSSGLDSTAVAALAARRVRDEGRTVTGFTMVPAHEVPTRPGLNPNEGPLASEMCGFHPNLRHVLLPTAPEDLFHAMDRWMMYCDAPVALAWSLAMSSRALQMIAASGSSQLLMGGRGNATISRDGLLALPGMLLRSPLRWLRLARDLRRRGELGGRQILSYSVKPITSALAAKAGLDATSRSHMRDIAALFPFREDFARKHGVEELLRAVGPFQGVDPSEYRIRHTTRPDLGDYIHYCKRAFGITLSDPTGDRRVAEFCLAIPEEEFIRGGERRRPIRRAMRGLVPDRILDSRAHGQPMADWFHTMTAMRPRIVEEVALFERNPLVSHCLDVPRMRKLVDDWPTRNLNDRDLRPAYQMFLGHGLSLGYYLRRFEEGF